MSRVRGFIDGLTNVFNELVNRRNAQNQNEFSGQRVAYSQLREIFRTGIGNKVVRIKAGHALKDTIQFGSTADREYYDARLHAKVKEAVRWMLAFGRGVIVIHHPGDDLIKPISTVDMKRVKLTVFSGDMVSPTDTIMDLDSERYYRPRIYTVRGHMFHWTRVIDFTYVMPPELEAPTYQYGGISEFELIHAQLINDGIVERASASILEKASSFVYKITGFKDALRAKKDSELVKYFGRIEDMRSIYGAVLLDAEDEATAVSQQLTNLAETSEGSLRRLAMVTGIPLPWLVGENVKGLNAVGENERQIFQDMIESLQSDYLLEPINVLMTRLGMEPIRFLENQGQTPTDRVTFDTKAIDNALKLWQMGEDYRGYLLDKSVIEKDDWDDYFGKEETEDESDQQAGMLAELLGVQADGQETDQQA